MNNGLLIQEPHPPAMPFGLRARSAVSADCYGLTGSDAYSGLTTLNAPLGGTTGSRLFADKSLNPKRLTPNGGVHVSDLQSVYGNGAAFFQGANDWIEASDNDELSPLSFDFTIEAWIYQRSSSSVAIICAKNEGGYPGGYEYAFYINAGRILGFGFYGTSFQGVQSASAHALNAWHHVAIVRSGSSFALYRNGALAASFTSAQSLRNTASRFTIGRDYETGQGGRFFDGFISNLRITRYARYLSTFAPPTGPFPAG